MTREQENACMRVRGISPDGRVVAWFEIDVDGTIRELARA